ncbi:hypothetical protein EPUS_00562 [Endocarpon pusillum Z07020]|uniref:Large ribosomal subunit protein uL23m n=1 Tax=Endocarpon pusillum (strain Z07020 / HMAS-L-300199) TaxID=1263415 RepID=U1GHH8_ENDPU|nr:uncharacterized protein EPUS_00562 [Endocarpon pusillum Z07020]ERF71573.1 hypothetical protein EPUS_00562 [Endocarpon pusillum Z07020]
MRTPHHPPKYASFWVPLWFNKLDFKNYLKNVYNVDVLHIRSYVQQSKVEREQRPGSRTPGRLFRPQARKRMTVELVDPFIYPEEEKDLSPWESETFKKELKQNQELSKEESRAIQPPMEPDLKRREGIAEQAQDFLQGRQRWRPSWQSIPTDTRVMQGTSRSPGIRGTI